ncbi:uncharacterized protein LOC133824385 [Humulus lupulus]|uniref:uncharacterized protein LOC133824385 n=1 Tax=Humulus lupulus TaxID=3486 RepID=UPI002B41524E|nr:uncharacterized protein LOC133824385 [Humulus lupulus]
MSWFSDGVSRNDGSESKFESAYVSEEGSPLQHSRRRTSQKSSFSEGAAGHSRTPASDKPIRRNASMDASLEQPKELTESPTVSYPSPAKLSVSLPSTSSFAASPLSSQGQVLPANSTPSRWPRHSPGHQLSRQESDTQMPGFKSPNSYSVSEERAALPSWRNESTRGSRGGSSDGWSMNAFSELMGGAVVVSVKNLVGFVLINADGSWSCETKNKTEHVPSPDGDFTGCWVSGVLDPEGSASGDVVTSVKSLLSFVSSTEIYEYCPVFVSQASKKALDPVAPVYKYCLVSVSNILTSTCQNELKSHPAFSELLAQYSQSGYRYVSVHKFSVLYA